MNNLKRMWAQIIKFNDKYFPKWNDPENRNFNLVFLSNALAGETGEVCNAVKHMLGGGTNAKDVTNRDIAIECFDLLVYWVLLLENRGFNADRFEKIFDQKMYILNKRMEKAGRR